MIEYLVIIEPADDGTGFGAFVPRSPRLRRDGSDPG